MALAQGSGELIWWPYLIAKYGLTFLWLLVPACFLQYPLNVEIGRYTLLERMAVLDLYAVAREAVEAAGADVMSKPVGTGPYRLVEWKRASRVVLEANPHYRTLAFPDSGDPAYRALVATMKGRKLPAIGRVEVKRWQRRSG